MSDPKPMPLPDQVFLLIADKGEEVWHACVDGQILPRTWPGQAEAEKGLAAEQAARRSRSRLKPYIVFVGTREHAVHVRNQLRRANDMETDQAVIVLVSPGRFGALAMLPDDAAVVAAIAAAEPIIAGELFARMRRPGDAAVEADR